MSDLEITGLVISEHEAFRRAFADLGRAGDVASSWVELEVQAVAEEQLFYPVLARAAQDGVGEGIAAVREHNDIRHAVQAVPGQDVGSGAWWDAVHAAQRVNAEHMAVEGREFIPDVCDSVPAERRADPGLQCLKFHDEHERAAGLAQQDADPQAVVDAEPPTPLSG